MAALLAGAASGQEAPWSEPVVNTYDPQPGVTETVATSKRNTVEGGLRTLESKSDIELRTPGWQGRYALVKKQVYAGAKLVTFYRQLEADLAGPRAFSLSERTQLAKGAKGSYKGTMLREYYLAGRQGGGPALRLLVHFEPYLLVRRYDAKLFRRAEDGSWPAVAQGTGQTFGHAMAALGRRASRGPSEPEAAFLLALWSGALAQGASMEMAQFLYPLLNAGAESYFEEVKLEPLLSRSQAALAAVGNRATDLARWQEISKSLASRRVALERAVTPAALKRDPERPAEAARLYAQAAELLLFSPKRPAPSPIQALQATTIWAAAAFGRFKTLPPGGEATGKFLSALPGSWARTLAAQRGEVYLRSLYVLAITRETRTLQSLIEVAERTLGPGALAESLRGVKSSMAGVAGAWRTPLALRPAAPLPGSLLGLLARLLVADAWAADTVVARPGAGSAADEIFAPEIVGMDITYVGPEVTDPGGFLERPPTDAGSLPAEFPPPPAGPDVADPAAGSAPKQDCR